MTVNRAINAIITFTHDSPNPEEIKNKLLPLQITTLRRFRSHLQCSKSWDEIFQHFGSNLEGVSAIEPPTALTVKELIPKDMNDAEKNILQEI